MLTLIGGAAAQQGAITALLGTAQVAICISLLLFWCVCVCVLVLFPFLAGFVLEKGRRGGENKKNHAGDLPVASCLLQCVHMGPLCKWHCRFPPAARLMEKREAASVSGVLRKTPLLCSSPKLNLGCPTARHRVPVPFIAGWFLAPKCSCWGGRGTRDCCGSQFHNFRGVKGF